MATASRTTARPPSAMSRPRSISQIARGHGVARATVRRLIEELGMPTYWIGKARVVDPADWPRLRRALGPVRRRARIVVGQ
jgi:hypothetical protein